MAHSLGNKARCRKSILPVFLQIMRLTLSRATSLEMALSILLCTTTFPSHVEDRMVNVARVGIDLGVVVNATRLAVGAWEKIHLSP